MALADELQSGAPVAGAPELHADLGVGMGVLALALLSAPGLVGVALESAVLAWSDHVDRRPLLVVALLAMAAFALGAALSPGPVALALALGLWGTACGIATGTAEAALVSSSEHPDRAMTRWSLAGALGDLVGPLLVGGVTAAGGSWRVALALTALLPLLDALAVARGPSLPGALADDDEERPSALEVLRDGELFAWLLAAAACTLMDEILVVFAALRMEALGHSPWARAAQLAAAPLGGALGLLVVDRALPRFGARRVLLAACALTAAAYVAWLGTRDPVAGAACLAVVGAGAAALWPLATAAAYARRPDRPGLVGAVEGLLTPVELAAPVVVGLVADRAGLVPALALLLLQPLVVGLVAARRHTTAS